MVAITIRNCDGRVNYDIIVDLLSSSVLEVKISINQNWAVRSIIRCQKILPQSFIEKVGAINVFTTI